MKGILSFVVFLVVGAFASPVLAQNSFFGQSPQTTADMLGTVKTINSKSSCNLQDAEPIAIEAIGNDGQPLADAILTIRMKAPRDDVRILPTDTEQIITQEKNRLILKTDKNGRAAVRFSKDATVGKYPLVVQTSKQEFDLNAICLGLRTDNTKQLLWILVGIEILLLLASLVRLLLTRRSQKILIVSDLHGHREAAEFVAEKLAKQHFDGLIVAGNLVDNTVDALQFAQGFIDLVKNQYKLPLYIIHGDSEPLAVTQFYAASGCSVHLNPLSFGRYTIYGLGGTDTKVPELNLPKQGQTIFVSRIPSLPQGIRPPFIQITGHAQSAFNTSKHGSTVIIDCPPATLGQAAILTLPDRSVSFLQAPSLKPVTSQGGLAWR
jgi:hypothetical protein